MYSTVFITIYALLNFLVLMNIGIELLIQDCWCEWTLKQRKSFHQET